MHREQKFEMLEYFDKSYCNDSENLYRYNARHNLCEFISKERKWAIEIYRREINRWIGEGCSKVEFSNELFLIDRLIGRKEFEDLLGEGRFVKYVTSDDGNRETEMAGMFEIRMRVIESAKMDQPTRRCREQRWKFDMREEFERIVRIRVFRQGEYFKLQSQHTRALNFLISLSLL